MEKPKGCGSLAKARTCPHSPGSERTRLVFEKVPDLWGECRKLRWQLYRLGDTPGIVADQFLGGLWLWHLVVALDNLLQGDDVMPFIAEGLVVWIIGSEREQHGLKGHHLERSYFVGQTLFSYQSG